jgi:hypothetical protein
MKSSESLEIRIAKKRTLISTFFFSVVAGKAFAKSLELFYAKAFPVHWTYDSLTTFFSPYLVFCSILFRFYIGNLLHIKSIEDNPPVKSNAIWAYDFLVIMLQFAIIYFCALCFEDYNIPRFVRLLAILLGLDCIWICSMWLLGKVSEKIKRPSIPYKWLYINLPSLIILCLWFWRNENDYSHLELLNLLIIFILCGIADIILTDRYFLFQKDGWEHRE